MQSLSHTRVQKAHKFILFSHSIWLSRSLIRSPNRGQNCKLWNAFATKWWMANCVFALVLSLTAAQGCKRGRCSHRNGWRLCYTLSLSRSISWPNINIYVKIRAYKLIQNWMPNASNWIHTHARIAYGYVCRESRIGVQWKGLMCVQKRKVCQMNFISAPWWHSLKRAELHEVHLWQTACDSMQRSIWCAHNLLIELERWREELGSSSEVSCVLIRFPNFN